MKKKKKLVYKNKNLYDGLDKKGFVTKGFAQASNEVMRELCINYHTNVAIIYFMLISHRHTDDKNEKYNQCFPTKGMLEKETGLSEDTIDKCVKTLKDNGYIIYRKGNSQYANQYFFPLEEFYKGEGDYLLKIDDEIVEEVSADNNIPSLAGNVLEEDNKSTFTPKGKCVNDDLFDEDFEPSTNGVTQTAIQETNVLIDSAGYIDDFYKNMHSYYSVNDEQLKTNKAIIKKVNSLVGFIEEELKNNNIENIAAEKVINDIMKNYQTSFTNALNSARIAKDFNKCTYIISCVENTFKNKKLKALLKHTKVDKVNVPLADQSFVDGLNEYYDDYIVLADGDRLNQKEIIRRINLIIRDETPERQKAIINIIDYVLKFYKKSVNTELKNCPFDLIKEVVKQLNDFYGYDFLVGRYDGAEYEAAPDNIIEIIRHKTPEEDKLKKQSDDLLESIKWKSKEDKTYVENGITYGVDKNGFSYDTTEVAFDYASTKPKIRENSNENDEFLAYLDKI